LASNDNNEELINEELINEEVTDITNETNNSETTPTPKRKKHKKELTKLEKLVRRRKITFSLLVLVVFGGTGAGVVAYNGYHEIQAAQEELGVLYVSLFTDSSKTEIKAGISQEDYEDAVAQYTLLSVASKTKYKTAQETLETQYHNQKATEDLLTSLYASGQDYLGISVTSEMFDQAYTSLESPYNKEYQATLRESIDKLKEQYDYNLEITELVNNMHVNGTLVELTQENFTDIDLQVSKIANPTIREDLANKVKVNLEEWTSREERRSVEKKALEESKAKAAAEKKAADEAKALQEALAEASKPVVEPQQVQAPTPTKSATIAANQIGINGYYNYYTSLGNSVNTDEIQGTIDQGALVSSLTSFNGSDGQTTYFSGHNPGIMAFMENNIYLGAIISVSDSNNNVTNYQVVDHVETDVYGEGWLSYPNTSAVTLFNSGAYAESIAIQYCNTSNLLMSVWYAVKI
jgi:hypothetical protein